jgi:hypothetical protein
LGKEAREHGCFRFNDEKTHEFADGRFISILHQTRTRWHMVDGTMRRDERDDRSRYLVGPKWDRNSCAIDCLVFCAIQIDAGRAQVDQLKPDLELTLPLAAVAIRILVGELWGTLDQGQRDALRNKVADMLTAMSPEDFPRYSPLRITPVVTMGLNRLPQVSYTAMPGSTCCDGVLMFSRSVTPERRTGFEITRENPSWSLEQVMAHLLGPRPMRQHQACTNGRQCVGPRMRSLVFLDRLPPTLLLHLPAPVTQGQDLVWQLFAPMELSYLTTKGTRRVRYRPAGCVVMISWGHFVVKWGKEENGRHQIIYYDGLKSPHVSNLSGWWDETHEPRERPRKSGAPRASNGSGVVTMFYRLYEST